MELILIFLISCFFAINMGAPTFAGSFATACGSKAIRRNAASLLFIVFVILGAVLLGKEVANTLSKGIIPVELITTKSVLIILFTATLSLFVANLMHIPQSTSLSTVAAIAGVGIVHHSVNSSKIIFLVICWVLSTIASFVIIYFSAKFVYPPRKSNFWIYERIVHHQQRLKKLVIFTSCYKAFAQGTNNVANVVGPLVAAGLIDIKLGMWVMGIIFGLGSFVFRGPMTTSSEKIVPLGLLTATIINLVSGTITIIASKLGVPLPTVIVYTVAIFAIGTIKDGAHLTLNNPLTKKTFFTWCINPALTFVLSVILSSVFLK